MATPRDMTTLREQTTRAFKWSYMSLGVNVLLAPLFAAILARLMTRKEFGVYDAALLLFTLGNFISDMGMGAALVQKARLTKGNVRAAFTSSLLLGGFMTLFGWLLAPLAGAYFKNPEVTSVFRGFSLIYVFITLSAVSTNLLRRKMSFKVVAVAETVAFVVGHGVVGLSAAKLGYGAMSLVISSFAQNLLMLVITVTAGKFQYGLTFRWKDYRDLYAFGTKSTLAGFADYLSQVVDRIMIGRFYDSATLGLYGRAFNTVCTPMFSFSRTLTRVLDASMSAVQSDTVRLRRAYTLSVTTLSVLLFPVAFGILVCAHEIVLVLLGKKFIEAVPVTMVLALYVPFPILGNLSSTLVTATAQLGSRIRIQIAYLVLLTVSFFVAYLLHGGLVGFAAMLLLVSALRSLAYAVSVGRIIGGGVLPTLKAYGVGLLSGVAVGAPLWLAVTLLRPHLPLPLLFATELLLGGGLLAAVLLFGPETEVQAILRRKLSPMLSKVQLGRKAKA